MVGRWGTPGDSVARRSLPSPAHCATLAISARSLDDPKEECLRISWAGGFERQGAIGGGEGSRDWTPIVQVRTRLNLEMGRLLCRQDVSIRAAEREPHSAFGEHRRVESEGWERFKIQTTGIAGVRSAEIQIGRRRDALGQRYL